LDRAPTSIAGRTSELLGAPKSVAVLAELAGINLESVASQIPRPHQPTGWGLDAHQLIPDSANPRPVALHEQCSVAATMTSTISDQQKLLVLVATVVSDWYWNPSARAAIPRLLSDAFYYGEVAFEVASSPGADWWWESTRTTHQVLLTEPSTLPSLEAAEAVNLYAPFEYPDLPYTRMLTTSTYVGEHAVSAQLCDIDMTSRIKLPIHCWKVRVDNQARIYEIRRPVDWLLLCGRYPKSYRVPDEWASYRLHARSRFGVDWNAVAADWDALHVSMSGLLTTVDLPIFVGADATLLQGFASDVTVWFRNCLSDPELITSVDGPLR
jgi:hypothetical protein